MKVRILVCKMVGREGFEPPKVEPVDLQSTPFDRSGIDPRTRSVQKKFKSKNKKEKVPIYVHYTS